MRGYCEWEIFQRGSSSRSVWSSRFRNGSSRGIRLLMMEGIRRCEGFGFSIHRISIWLVHLKQWSGWIALPFCQWIVQDQASWGACELADIENSLIPFSPLSFLHHLLRTYCDFFGGVYVAGVFHLHLPYHFSSLPGGWLFWGVLKKPSFWSPAPMSPQYQYAHGRSPSIVSSSSLTSFLFSFWTQRYPYGSWEQSGTLHLTCLYLLIIVSWKLIRTCASSLSRGQVPSLFHLLGWAHWPSSWL